MSSFKAPTLKDCITEDIDKAFLNLKEYAEIIEFDGTEIPAVIDNNDSREPATKESDALGVYKWDRRLHAKAADMPRKPDSGDYIRLNGGMLQYVAQVEEEAGMYMIYLVGSMR